MKKTGILLLSILLATITTASLSFAKPKNVILMIADGWGYNQIISVNYYTGNGTVYAAKNGSASNGFTLYGVSTYPLNLSATPNGTNVQDSNIVYDCLKAWPGENWSTDQAVNWLKATATDSAAAATALNTGTKTFNSSINWSDINKAITQTTAKKFKDKKKSVGSISTVAWSHATPAAVYAHNISRGDYVNIAKEGVYGKAGDGNVYGPIIDVIMGAGNPDFDDNGNPANPKKDAGYVGGDDIWNDIKDGSFRDGKHIHTRAEFQALVSKNPKGRYIGTIQAYSTAQQSRSLGINRLESVPTLAEMSLGALNILDNNKNGFYLMIEGGAVDWANHANQQMRMIEEMQDYNNAVAQVCKWVEKNSSWKDTLLIVTGDHETGFLWGNDGVFQPVIDKGAGQIPGMKYYYTSHTNCLIPAFVKGSGSEEFINLADQTDPVRGKFIDNTEIYKAIVSTLNP